jgi:hypothetical protein
LRIWRAQGRDYNRDVDIYRKNIVTLCVLWLWAELQQ